MRLRHRKLLVLYCVAMAIRVLGARMRENMWGSMDRHGRVLSCAISEYTAAAMRCFLYVDARTGEKGLVSILPAKHASVARFVMVSDTHGNHAELTLPPGDVLVHLGDILYRNGGAKGTTRGAQETLEDFNRWLGKHTITHTHRVVIAGNHDGELEKMGAQAAQKLLTNALYLENSGVDVLGLKLWGCPWSAVNRSPNKAFKREEMAAKTWFDMVPQDVDVLLTHALKGGAGIHQLRDRVRPLVHAGGHLHLEYGVTEAAHGGLIVCAAVCDDSYRIAHPPVVVDVPIPGARSSKNNEETKEF